MQYSENIVAQKDFQVGSSPHRAIILSFISMSLVPRYNLRCIMDYSLNSNFSWISAWLHCCLCPLGSRKALSPTSTVRTNIQPLESYMFGGRSCNHARPLLADNVHRQKEISQ
jgi:hypothetical protein